MGLDYHACRSDGQLVEIAPIPSLDGRASPPAVQPRSGVAHGIARFGVLSEDACDAGWMR